MKDGADLKILGDTDNDVDLTPRNKRAELRRSYAIADIAQISNVSNDEYEQEPERKPEADGQGQDSETDGFYDEPTPKKRQRTIKVPVREAINANRKENKSQKAENNVSRFIVECYRLGFETNICLGL